MIALIDEKQKQSQPIGNKEWELYQKKQKFSPWLRKIIFSWWNPVYAMWKIRKKNKITTNCMSLLSADFTKYCLTENLNFDTEQFYPIGDEIVITTYIDNRLKDVLGSYEELFNEENKKLQNLIKKQKDYFKVEYKGKKYNLPENYFQFSVFENQYGLSLLPYEAKKYIEGKDFLDIGAYIGDSILLLLQYNPSKIFAYEPVSMIFEKLNKTLKINDISPEKAIPIKKGIGDNVATQTIYVEEGASSLILQHRATTEEKIELSTIDIESKDKNVGLIKMDVEGFEYYAIGGLETIKRDKPVLLISLYHTGKDFFEIPPILKAAVPEYKFRFLDNMPFQLSEKILMAYV